MVVGCVAAIDERDRKGSTEKTNASQETISTVGSDAVGIVRGNGRLD